MGNAASNSVKSSAAGDAAEASPSDLPAVGEFTRLALWMSGSIAGLTTPTHAAHGRHFRDMARRLGWPPGRRAAAPVGDAALGVLAEALVGSSRWAMASVFGPPRYAVADDGVGDAVWSGRAWYYAMRHPLVSAVAVEFEDDAVRRVVFVRLEPAAVAA